MSTKFLITCFDLKGQEQHFELQADDEATALGLVLDEWADEIAHGSPFMVECATALDQRTDGCKKAPARSKDTPEAVTQAVSAKNLPGPVRLLLEKVAKETGCTTAQ